MSNACHKCRCGAPRLSPLPHASAGVDDDDGCDDADAAGDGDGDGQCGNVGIGFCLLQLCETAKKRIKKEIKNI